MGNKLNNAKVAVCEYLLQVNEDMDPGHGHKFIAPTAINWLGDGIVSVLDRENLIVKEEAGNIERYFEECNLADQLAEALQRFDWDHPSLVAWREARRED